MGAGRRRSRKRSAANSKPQHKKFVFFLDRNLGREKVRTALRKAGELVEIHDDHLPLDAPDEDWIHLVARENWIAITKDKNIRYRAWERRAIKQYRARVFVITAKNLTGDEIGELLVRRLKKIKDFIEKHEAPFLAGITRGSDITKYLLNGGN